MSVNLIELAKLKVAGAEQRLQKLQAEEERIKKDLLGWQEFILKAESLTTTETHLNNEQEQDKPKVKKDSLAGLCAQQIRDHGPMPLKDLAEILEEMGKGEGLKDFRTALNTALWRRRNDVFNKVGKDYHLRTEELEFVD